MLAVKAKWIKYLPIYNEKDRPIDFVTFYYPQYMNDKFLKVKPKEIDQLDNNLFTTNFSQEIQSMMKLTMSLKKFS